MHLTDLIKRVDALQYHAGKWLRSPVFPDDEIKTRRADVLNAVLLGGVALGMLTLVAGLFDPAVHLLSRTVNVAGILMCLQLLHWLRQGYVAASSIGLIVLAILCLIFVIADLGTIRNPATAAFVISIIAAGLLFDLRGVVLTVFASAAAVLALYLAEIAGLLPPPQENVSPIHWLAYVLLFIFIGEVMFLARRSTHRALARAKKELEERQRAETGLRESEARYRRLVTHSQDLIYRMSLPDGQYEYVSPAVTAITGYTPQDLYATPRLMAQLVHPRWRDYFETEWNKLVAGEMSPTYEYQIVTATGQIRWLHQRNVLVRDAQGAPIAIEAIVNDVTAQKRAEAIAVARSRLLHAALTHDANTILEVVLDRAEELTESRIGFFHFLEADQKTLVLQNWSTRTKTEYCTAGGKGLHYSVDAAGVWANCVRERRAVIYNTYETLPDRRGMPAGHAVVTRMIAAPIMRGQLIVGIIGVGNAPYDYTMPDVEVITELADLSWDIVERKHAQAALQASEQRYRIVADNTYDWEFWASPDGALFYSSPSCLRITGHTAQEFQEHPDLSWRIVHPDDRALLVQHQHHAHQNFVPGELEFRIVLPDGALRWIHHVCQPVYDATGNFLGTRGSNRDVTARKIADAQLAYLGAHDSLTGLYNRAFFEAELARIEHSRDFPVSLLVADLDNLKRTNDTRGHAAGDALLKRAAQALESVFRTSDVLARIGGDEFAVILPHTDEVTAQDILQRLHESLAAQQCVNGEAPLCLSVGIATGEQDDLMQVLRRADLRMYAEKRSHKRP